MQDRTRRRRAADAALVFAVTLAVRFALLACGGALGPLLTRRPPMPLDSAEYGARGPAVLPPLTARFILWGSSLDAATWREALYWRAAAGALPPHLRQAAPWWVALAPPAAAAAGDRAAAAALSLCDAAAAALVSTWPSCTLRLVLLLASANPAVALPTVCGAATGPVFLALALVVECARRGGAALLLLGAALVALLGRDYAAAAVPLLLPVGTTRPGVALAAAAAAVLAVGAYAVAYLRATRATHERAPLFSPPDGGTLWAVRQLVLPDFERALEAVLTALPPLLQVPAALALPAPPAAPVHPPLVPNPRVFAVVYAVGCGVVLGAQPTLSSISVAVLLLYASLNPRATRRGRHNHRRVTWSVHTRVRLLVPAYALALATALQIGFYTVWVLRENTNANWLFYAQAGLIIGSVLFLALWLDEAAEDSQWLWAAEKARVGKIADSKKKD